MPVKELLEACKVAMEQAQLREKRGNKLNGYPYKPNKIVKVQNWTLRFYKTEHIATCHLHGTNVTYVITETTDKLNHLPNYVLKALTKEIFLKEWTRKKVDQSVTRLNQIGEKWQRLKDEGVI